MGRSGNMQYHCLGISSSVSIIFLDSISFSLSFSDLKLPFLCHEVII